MHSAWHMSAQKLITINTIHTSVWWNRCSGQLHNLPVATEPICGWDCLALSVPLPFSLLCTTSQTETQRQWQSKRRKSCWPIRWSGWRRGGEGGKRRSEQIWEDNGTQRGQEATPGWEWSEQRYTDGNGAAQEQSEEDMGSASLLQQGPNPSQTRTHYQFSQCWQSFVFTLLST